MKRPTMKADVTGLRETKKTYARRNTGFDREIAALDPATGRAVVTVRIYWPASTAYCALWIGAGDKWGRGQRKAGGYGYHKPSAAMAEAIRDAGIKLSQSISGVGYDAMEKACEAIARAVTGKRRFIIHTAHA